MGDFYEMFFDDAELGARVLGITLTARGDGVPLAGAPVKAAAEYLRSWSRRVIAWRCASRSRPAQGEGIVKRAVIETITPGAVLDDTWLSGNRNNFIARTEGWTSLPGAERGRTDSVGLAAIDLSTGEFLLETVSPAAVGSAGPLESCRAGHLIRSNRSPGPTRNAQDTTERWEFDPELARDEIARRFLLASLDGLGIESADVAAVGAAGPCRYLTDLQPGGIPHLQRPVVRRADRFMWVDEMTRRNLELVEPPGAAPRASPSWKPSTALSPRWGHDCSAAGCSPLRRPDRDQRAARCRKPRCERPAREGARSALDGVRDLERLPAAPPRDVRPRGTWARSGTRSRGFLPLPLRSTD